MHAEVQVLVGDILVWKYGTPPSLARCVGELLEVKVSEATFTVRWPDGQVGDVPFLHFSVVVFGNPEEEEEGYNSSSVEPSFEVSLSRKL